MKRLLEEDFPLKEVSEESVREKNIRRGHISALHIWWARRPLAASRATTFAALVPTPKNHDELRRKLEFVAELSKWENSLNKRLIENARKEILDSFGGRSPKVLDCFAGGGAIPLEALRLGCETYALELNPVAVLILKAVLDYPQKYGEKLVKDVKRWRDWVYSEARREIGRFYPEETITLQKALSDKGGVKYVPVSYIWTRTIRCQNPSCNAEIPLIRQFWLARKENRKIALKMVVDKKNKKINFKIAQGKEIDFDPSVGTTRRATVRCPVCEAGIDGETVRKEAREGRMGQRLVVVVLHNQKEGKTYRIASENDIEVFKKAENFLGEKVKKWKWNFNPIPDESLPQERVRGFSGFRVLLYGMSKWGDLFNSRQKLGLITFVDKIKLSYEKMIEEGYEEEYAKTIISYLALTLSRVSDFLTTICRWHPQWEFVPNTFARQAIPMAWDYAELNPFSPILTGTWKSMSRQALRVIEASIIDYSNVGHINEGTATRLPYKDNFFNAVITDPPYYDNVAYGDLSDFFYVWLKRAVGEVYPEIFATPLTPKSQEIIQDPARGKNASFFEETLTKAFHEIYRVLKPEGIATIVFAHKSTDAWETIINSLLKSGLVLTASWPIHTEMKARLLAQQTAALASSVYMVCRKRTKQQTAYFNDIRDKIEERIKEKLTQFWEQGISGADFFVSAIGPAVEVFGKYSKVEKLSGEEVTVQELLEYVRKIVSEFALERVLKNADLGGVDSETRFYLLWRWTFGNAKVHFDDAIKLSRPMGVELTDIWDRGELVKKEKEFIRVLDPKERAKDPSFMKKTKFTSMTDVLHRVLISWERGEREKIKEILHETGYARNEIFWQTAQALSEILPEGDKERQLLQGFLYGKETYIREARKRKRTLLEFVESS